MGKPTAVIIGASPIRSKYGNKSVRAHAAKGYDVYPVNPTARDIEGLTTYPDIGAVPVPIDRVSMYVPPKIGLQLIESIARCKPKEVWLNPGAESPELIEKGESLGLNIIVGCSIVELGSSPWMYPD